MGENNMIVAIFAISLGALAPVLLVISVAALQASQAQADP